ncbi:MAG: glycosyltransferase [Firmicutes bacterium]|nr:glycosyltransferase [Bacillota bacterium]
MKLSVVICTHNRADLLAGSIMTLDKQEGIESSDYEIVVVDDGSTDHTRDAVEKLKTKVPVSYYFKDWGGRAEARNLGIEKAQGEIIVFVDDDVLAPPHFLLSHLKEYKDGEKTVVRGPIVNVQEYVIIPDFTPKMFHMSGAFFCTCNASSTRKILMEIGGFDPGFKEYGFEDNEIGWRLRQHGCKVNFSMDAYIFHYKPVESKKREQVVAELKSKAGEMGRSAAIYFSKHPHWKVKMAVGLHPLNYYFQRILSCKPVAEYSEKVLLSGKSEGNPVMHAFFTDRIFQHHYLSSIRNALSDNGGRKE